MEKVKKLRSLTGAGMLDCQKALREVDGDVDAAIDLLRKKGIMKAAKKSDRIASEGAIAVSLSDDGKRYGVVELNCETDFVARNEKFRSAANELAEHARDNDFNSLDNFLSSSFHGTTIEEHIKILISTFGENTVVRRANSRSTDGNFKGTISFVNIIFSSFVLGFLPILEFFCLMIKVPNFESFKVFSLCKLSIIE